MFKECPRKFYLGMVQQWRAKSESVHLKFGIIIHAALETFDKARALGADYEEALDRAFDYALRATWDNGPWQSDHPKKNRDSLLRTIVWYLETYKDDKVTTVQLADGTAAVEVSFRVEFGYSYNSVDYLLCGHLDRLINYGDDIYVADRKTTSGAIGAYYFKQYSPHNQMSLYTLAGKVVYSAPVAGVVIDAMQIGNGFSNFGRGFTLRTKSQLDEWLDDAQQWMEYEVECADRDKWPMNENSCHNYYSNATGTGGCPFLGICNKDPAVREAYLKTDFEKVEWNPLIPR